MLAAVTLALAANGDGRALFPEKRLPRIRLVQLSILGKQETISHQLVRAVRDRADVRAVVAIQLVQGLLRERLHRSDGAATQARDEPQKKVGEPGL